MGIYLNPGNEGVQESVCSEIYVDKTGLIKYTNKYLNTKQKFLCVSRPRRFGKSMAQEVAATLDRAHTEIASNLDYNNGAALSCAVIQ